MPITVIQPDGWISGAFQSSTPAGAGSIQYQKVNDSSDATFVTDDGVLGTIQYYTWPNLPATAAKIITHTQTTRQELGSGSFVRGTHVVLGTGGPLIVPPGPAPSGIFVDSAVDLGGIPTPGQINSDVQTGYQIRNGLALESHNYHRIEWSITWAGKASGFGDIDAISILPPLLAIGLGNLVLFHEDFSQEGRLQRLITNTLKRLTKQRFYIPCLWREELRGEREELLWSLFRKPVFSF